ncbi:MAG: DUF2179 domain-containing protein [Candidatus Cloacimonetes bacterium]|nr:DUF2179 domain-containing protein [Candidatus Cloacimonadota bacterium]
MQEIFSSPIFIALLPLLIFLSRIVDVTLGTIRIIFVSKGLKYLAPMIGFFEVLIWLTAMSQIMQNLNSPINYIAYASGFAAGNFVGIYLENKLAVGVTLIRIITAKNADSLIGELVKKGYRVTHTSALANGVESEIIFMPVRRKEISTILALIEENNPNALYTIEDVRSISKRSLPVMSSADQQREDFSLISRNQRRKGK